MSITSPVLSAEDLRRIRDYMPSLSNRPDGNVDLGAKINTLAAETVAELGGLVMGVATILNGQTAIVIAVGTEFNGKLAVVSFAEAPTAALRVWSGAVAGGNLTITINQDNTADLDVHYLLDAR